MLVRWYQGAPFAFTVDGPSGLDLTTATSITVQLSKASGPFSFSNTVDVTKTLTDGVTVVSPTIFTVEFDESDSEDLSGSYRMQFNIVDVSGVPAIWAISPIPIIATLQ